jgi:hypothetical protein
VPGRIAQGLAQWRALGPRRGTAAAVRFALGPPRRSLRRAWLKRRPLALAPGELAAALGGSEPLELLRGPVLAALPSVGAFERELAALERPVAAELLAVATAVAEHRFDLLGSGPTELGERIDWQLDFKSGRSWPLMHISRLQISYPDHSDIKVAWELSRFQHLPVLAAAHRLTGDRRWLAEIAAQLESWIDANPVEFGANWACTMDVAIRAANWLATLALVAEAATQAPWVQRVLSSLLLHGRFIRSHLEYAPVRGNHYLADVVGLLCLASLFSAGDEGRAWAQWAAQELVAERAHQVRADGCDHEASIPYHRLVSELFLCGTAAAEALSPGHVTASHRAALGRMLAFVASYTRPDSLAPQVGDADDGRFLPLGDYGRSDPRSHLHLFAQAAVPYEPAREGAAYPEGGYWIMRAADLYVLVRCGDVGIYGLGSHAHNDALSFELALGRQPLVVDPGSYLYTADPLERNRFRSTAFHSTLEIDGAEQNPLGAGELFTMEDRRQAEAVRWESSASGALFAGRHHGYATLDTPATHTRTLVLEGEARTLRIIDTVTSPGVHQLRWTFPLARCQARVAAGVLLASFPGGVSLEIEGPGLEFYIEPGWLSPSYGRREAVPFARARRRSEPGEDRTELTLRVRGAAGR